MIPNNVMQILSRHPLIKTIKNMQSIKTPDELAQELLNTGKVNQNQVNMAKRAWEQRQDLRQQVHDQFGF